VRDLICERKISGAEWLDVMRAAHGVGLKSNATMLYGHVETPGELADHMIALRDLQDETGGFNAFIPLSFQPANTGLSELPGPTGFDDLKVLAVGRLVLDNFCHIKAFWINVGLRLAQVSLSFGVNDLDGTVVEEKISHAAGVDTGQELTRAELVRVIRGAGRVPVERDTLYNVVRRYDDGAPA
jgi:aminodeoxyfutalosine synthase